MTSKRPTLKWIVACAGLIFFTLVGIVGLLQVPSQVAHAEEEDTLLFYASFEKGILADQAVGDENPLANQDVKLVREGKKGGAIYLETGSLLSYEAPGNLYAERGTIGFWWKLDEPLRNTPFHILRISYAQQVNEDFSFAELFWTGNDLRLRFHDRESQTHEIVAHGPTELVSGRWFHLAFNWDELDGFHLYVDGVEAGRELGEFHLDASLDQVGIHTRELTPQDSRGNQRRVFIDEFRIYGVALSSTAIQNLTLLGSGRAGVMPTTAVLNPEFWNRHWKARFGWQENDLVSNLVSPGWIRKVTIFEGRDQGKRSCKGTDGKSETGWPMPGAGAEGAGKQLDLKADPIPFNSVQVQGNFRGRISLLRDGEKRLLLDTSSSGASAVQAMLSASVSSPNLTVERQDGILRELSLFSWHSGPADETPEDKVARASPSNRLTYRLLPSSEALNLQGVSRGQIATLYNLRTKLTRRYLPDDRRAWVGVPPEIFPSSAAPSNSNSARLQLHHLVIPPFLRHTPLDAVRLKLSLAGKDKLPVTLLNLCVKDPVYFQRDLINVNFKLPAGDRADLVVDFPDIVMPAGAALWMTLASDQKDFGNRFLTGAEVDLWMSETEQGPRAERARKEYLADRLGWMRESFQTLSQTSPWLMPDLGKIRRLFKGTDELFLVINDILRVDPEEPTALAYSGWVKRSTSPPDFKQPSPPNPDIPFWGFQQQQLVQQFKQVTEWWMKNRQRASGEMGDGLDQDTNLMVNWPAVALMEGPSERLKSSVLAVVEACYRHGLVTHGFNAKLSEPLQAYQQGLNLIPLASLLDYGNPLWIERLMEATANLDRITAINAAGHRHFRSYLFSDTKLVEEGEYGREDVHSALLWQPGLALAWYNRNPRVLRWMTEYADALLAHWEKDNYPKFKLSQAFRFFTDDVLSRGLPQPEVVNFLAAAYRLSSDSKYLWLLDQLAQGGDVGTAETASGRWLEWIDAEANRAAILQEVRERDIWNRNLQSDETGLLARQFAYELTGDKKYVQDYQAALIKHMAQNRMLYTEAEPAVGRLRFPHRALQRARLGGVASFEHVTYPGHAVSWEGADGNLAALVAKANSTNLKMIVFNSSKNFLDLSCRIWDLENGTYEVIEGTDVDGDDQIDVVTTRRTLPLKRFSSIPFTLRHQRITVIEIKQIKKGTPSSELSDLAIGPEDLHYDPTADKGSLTIHNIGAKKSPSFVLQVENEKHVIALKKEIEPLDAPEDLKPRKVTVDFSGLRVRGTRVLIFRIDPDNRVEEINEENNTLRRIVN